MFKKYSTGKVYLILKKIKFQLKESKVRIFFLILREIIQVEKSKRVMTYSVEMHD